MVRAGISTEGVVGPSFKARAVELGVYPLFLTMFQMCIRDRVGELVNQLLLETEKSGIPQEYINRNIVPGKKIQIIFGETKREVIAKEILSDGRLLAINEKDEEEIFPSGDVSVRW